MSESTTKISPQEHSEERWCELHHCEKIPGTGEHFQAILYCQECKRLQREEDRRRADERFQQKREEERQRQYPMLQEKAGVPRRFLGAALEHVIADNGPQQEVLAVLRQFVDSQGREPSSLILAGKLGTGKTYSGCALVNAWLWAGRNACFVTAIGLVREVRDSWRGTDSTVRECLVIQRFATVALLVIDEIGLQNHTQNENVILADILNQRYGNMLPTVVIGNLTIQELTTVLGEPTIDRFHEGGRALSFTWGSRR
jgi:DNA replication protein DnaC